MCRVCQIVKDLQRITAIIRGFLWCRHQCRQVGPVCFETSTGDGADYAAMQYVVRDAPTSIQSVLYRCIAVTARAFETESKFRFLIIQAGHMRRIVYPCSSPGTQMSRCSRVKLTFVMRMANTHVSRGRYIATLDKAELRVEAVAVLLRGKWEIFDVAGEKWRV